MSDPDALPDPIDKAYVEAEAVLSDEAARVARRARVLAAVASEGAPDAATPAARPRAWRSGGWLAAACVSGLALVVALQLYRPPAFPPRTRPTAVASAAAANVADATPAPAAPARASEPPARDAQRAAKAQSEPPPVALAGSPAPPAEDELAPRPAPAPEPAPPPPPEADAASERAAPVQPASPPQPRDRGGGDATAVTEMVVTGEKRQSRLQSAPAAVSAFTGQNRQAFDPGAQLRAAAADGRTKEMQILLEHGAPVDSQDADGDTALIRSIEADQPAAAALLSRHGASLDHRNHAGESARDLAAAKGDAALNRAIGLGP